MSINQAPSLSLDSAIEVLKTYEEYYQALADSFKTSRENLESICNNILDSGNRNPVRSSNGKSESSSNGAPVSSPHHELLQAARSGVAGLRPVEPTEQEGSVVLMRDQEKVISEPKDELHEVLQEGDAVILMRDEERPPTEETQQTSHLPSDGDTDAAPPSVQEETPIAEQTFEFPKGHRIRSSTPKAVETYLKERKSAATIDQIIIGIWNKPTRDKWTSKYKKQLKENLKSLLEQGVGLNWEKNEEGKYFK